MIGRPLRLQYVTMAPPLPAQSGYAVRIQTIGEAIASRADLRFLVLAQYPDATAEAATKARFSADFVPAQIGSKWLRGAIQLRAVAASRSRWVEKYRSGSNRTAALSAIAKFDPDYVIAGSIAFWELLRSYGVPANRIVVDHHNVESENYARMRASRRGFGWLAAAADLKALRNAETRCRAAADHWAVSQSDADTLTELLGAATHSVPNIAKREMFSQSPAGTEPDAPPVLAYMGNYHYYPNVEAVFALCDVLRVLRARGVVAEAIATGLGATAAMHKAAKAVNLTLPGFVVDLEPLLSRFTLLVAPIRSGAGTKLKILEALAMGLPVVTTPRGAEGIPIAEEAIGVVADETNALADAVQDLLSDREALYAMGQRARSWARNHAAPAVLNAAVEARLDALALGITPDRAPIPQPS